MPRTKKANQPTPEDTTDSTGPEVDITPEPTAPENTVEIPVVGIVTPNGDIKFNEPVQVLEPMPDIIESSERVVFEGQHVVAVLYDGRELRDTAGKITHYHCTLADGTTRHVPVTCFTK